MAQNDLKKWWFLLDDQHADYAAIIADLSALATLHGETYTNVAGAVANTRVVYSYMSAAQKAASSPSLAIGGCVLDAVNYLPHVNPHYAAPTIRTSPYGDSHLLFGSFLTNPQKQITTGIDRLVQHWKDGLESIYYIAQANAGTGDGSSYANRRKVSDFCGVNAGSDAVVNPATKTILVLCGRLSKFYNEGNGHHLFPKLGSSGTRTQVISHPCDPAIIMGGSKIGGGHFTEDADWTDDGGGRWHMDVALGNTDAFPRNFVMDDEGPLTKVADAAACTAMARSWARATDIGGKDRFYVHNTAGTNPKNTTYFGMYGGGIQIAFGAFGDTSYFDVFGVTCYMTRWLGVFMHGDKFGAYNCTFMYGGGYYFHGAQSYDPVNEATGEVSSFNYFPSDRVFMGCKVAYYRAGFYDSNPNGVDTVAVNTTIQDNVIEHIGQSLALAYGVELGAEDDTHAIATMGCRGAYWINNGIRYCAHVPMFHYAVNSNFWNPTGGLESTPLYVIGYPEALRFNEGNGSYTYYEPVKDIHIEKNLIRDIVTQAENAQLGPNGRGIQLGGDGDAGWGYLDQLEDVGVQYNRIEGNFSDGAIVSKWKPAGANDETQIVLDHNVILGAGKGFLTFGTTTAGGNTLETSFTFSNNLVHAENILAAVNNSLNPNFHQRVLSGNQYCTEGGLNWTGQGEQAYTTLAAWRAAAPAGDNYDNDSITRTIPVSAGAATVEITGSTAVGGTLTAAVTGTTYNLSYMWLRDGEEIDGATASTYVSTAKDVAAVSGVSVCIMYQDANDLTDLMTGWNLETSEQVQITGGDPPEDPPAGSRGSVFSAGLVN